MDDEDVVFIRFEGYRQVGEVDPTDASRKMLAEAVRNKKIHYVRTDPDGIEVYATTERALAGKNLEGRFVWIVDVAYRRGNRTD